MSKIKKTLFSSGLDKSDYNIVKPRIDKDNREKLMVFSVIAAGIFLFAFLLSLAAESLVEYRVVYIAGIVGSFSVFIAVKLFKENRFGLYLAVYFFLTLMIVLSMFISIQSADELSVLFIAALLVLSLLFTDRPIYILSFFATSTAVFILLCLKFKTGLILEVDIMDSLIFFMLSALMSTYMNCIKCRNHFYEYRIEQMGVIDSLTGIGNRNAYEYYLSHNFENGVNKDCVFVLADINGLKKANDLLGHMAGDELICGAAECIKKTFGKYGSCFRIGGDEFCAVLFLSYCQFTQVCDDFAVLVDAWRGKHVKTLKVAYGYACAWDHPNTSAEQLCKKADQMLYREKARYYQALEIECCREKQGNPQK